MSYILDALRKSEQERQRGKVPDIHGMPSESDATRQKKSPWPYIVLALVIMNAVILAIFWKQFTSSTDTESHVAEPESVLSTPQALVPPVAVKPTPIPEPAQQAVLTPSRAPAPAPAPVPVSKPAPVQPQEPLPSVGYMPQLEELPAGERQGIPDMTFSSHMYSSIPKYRSIIINGKRLKEGQFFNDQLQVREITDSGVIMSRGGTLFEVDVLGRWAQ
jgi:general secretion pathway protein B